MSYVTLNGRQIGDKMSFDFLSPGALAKQLLHGGTAGGPDDPVVLIQCGFMHVENTDRATVVKVVGDYHSLDFIVYNPDVEAAASKKTKSKPASVPNDDSKFIAGMELLSHRDAKGPCKGPGDDTRKRSNAKSSGHKREKKTKKEAEADLPDHLYVHAEEVASSDTDTESEKDDANESDVDAHVYLWLTRTNRDAKCHACGGIISRQEFRIIFHPKLGGRQQENRSWSKIWKYHHLSEACLSHLHNLLPAPKASSPPWAVEIDVAPLPKACRETQEQRTTNVQAAHSELLGYLEHASKKQIGWQSAALGGSWLPWAGWVQG